MRSRYILAAILLITPLHAARRAPRRPHGPARAAAPKGAPSDDTGLVDWSRQPFSDLSSHGVLVRQSPGLLAWRLRSAWAFGSQAARPNPAKDLVDVRMDFVVEGEPNPRFAAQALSLSSKPRWAQESGDDGDLHAEAVTVFSATDVAVAAANVKNTGKTPLRVRPRLHLMRSREGLNAQVLQAGTAPLLQLSLDRSAAVGRRLLEHVTVQMGGQAGRAAWLLPGQLKPLEAGKAEAPTAGQDLELELTWPAPQLLQPGQTLRVPLLLAWGTDEAAVQKAAAEQWRDSALPTGKAWSAAQARWAVTKSRLPQAPEPGRQRLLTKACLDLLLADYAPRANLNSSQFSAQKGQRDSFNSIESPFAALGWAEMDQDKAESELMDLSSFSAAAPAPLPPDTGDEKLAWEAAGLPLHAWAAWELYHRDPQAPRAGRFLTQFGQRLRNECAWWPEARDGDHNGLYAFARDEEMPPYLQRQKPGLSNLLAPAPQAGTGPLPSLQTWSLALTSLVAWQYTAASALAGAAGDTAEANRWLDLSQKSKVALATEAWDTTANAYRQGLDATWYLVLGLEENSARAKGWLDRAVVPSLSVGEKPWIEGGIETPWRFYILARTLAAYGYLDLERELSSRFLSEMDKKDVFDAEFSSNAALWKGGSAATAAVIVELALQRQEQDLFLTPFTGEFTAPFIQLRTLDGNFYLKRVGLPDKKEKYADIKVETPNHGPILSEKSLIFSSDERVVIQIQSEWPLDILDLHRKGALIFKQSHKVELVVQPKTRIQVRFSAPAGQN
jgi:hypothetical protein